MEIRSYNQIINDINNYKTITGINIDEIVELSNELLNNLYLIEEIGINNILMYDEKNNLKEIYKYTKNKDNIFKINEYYKNIQKQLSYTLQYQRHKKLNYLINNKKNIYSNK